MNLSFDTGAVIEGYHSKTQIARILTETWVARNMYCPRCGYTHITHFENNRPVADFFCPACGNEYELKSQSRKLSRKVNDGAFDTMIKRITANNNPDFFFMHYSKTDMRVRELILVPKHFFTPAVIEKRKPLPPTARRAGWVGCNILIGQIPEQGRISIISNGIPVDAENVVRKMQISKRLEVRDIGNRVWTMDILACINRVAAQIFTLEDIYRYERELQAKHPQNHHIRPKIRQQLQFLRDLGYITFMGRGRYQIIQ